MEHDCHQATRIALMERDCMEIKDDLKAILEAVVGNGKPGLKMEVDRLKQQQSRLWWVLSGVGSSVLGVIGYIIRGYV